MKLTATTSQDPWQVSAEDFPAGATTTEKWEFLLRYAVLAPSSHNSQPWQFHLGDDHLGLYADPGRACPIVDPDDRELTMSCGCALFHLRTAMRHFGCLGQVQLLPDHSEPDLLARVSLGAQGETAAEQAMLFHAIPKRRTNRQQFRDDPVPPPLLVNLQAAAENEGCWLRLMLESGEKSLIADLVAKGDRRQWASKSFRHELAKWVHSNRSRRHDGIPGYARGIDDLMSCAGPLIVRTFDLGAGQAAKDHEVATGSPALAVLGTHGDSPREWLAAGEALARVLLRARIEDVWASFLNQPIEVPYLRLELAGLLGNSGIPQAILRLGFGDDVRPTPRRDIEEVLI